MLVGVAGYLWGVVPNDVGATVAHVDGHHLVAADGVNVVVIH